LSYFLWTHGVFWKQKVLAIAFTNYPLKWVWSWSRDLNLNFDTPL